MPVPTNEWELYNFDDHIEAALVAIFNAQTFLGASPGAQGKRGENTNMTPRVVFEFFADGVEGHRHNRFVGQPSQYQPYDTWKFRLVVDVVSNRTDNTRTITGFTHKVFVAWVRWNLQYFRLAQYWTLTVAPYHAPNEIAEQGEAVNFSTEDGTDTTTLTFVGTINVRPLSWPLV